MGASKNRIAQQVFRGALMRIGVLLVCSVFYTVQGMAETGFTLSQQVEATSITSDSLVFENLKNKLLFEGQVLMKKGSLTVHADRAELLLTEAPTLPSTPSHDAGLSQILARGERKISQILLTGHLKMEQEETHATAEKGLYNQEKNEITLTGMPVVWSNNYRLTGKVIVLSPSNNKIRVENSEVLFYPETKK